MRSNEIRSLLRRGKSPERDTRRIHDLARALARERLHLVGRPVRPARDGDLLWARDRMGYKIASRTVASLDDTTTFEVSASSDADYLIAVFLEKGSFRLLGMARIPWSMVDGRVARRGARHQMETPVDHREPFSWGV